MKNIKKFFMKNKLFFIVFLIFILYYVITFGSLIAYFLIEDKCSPIISIIKLIAKNSKIVFWLCCGFFIIYLIYSFVKKKSKREKKIIAIITILSPILIILTNVVFNIIGERLGDTLGSCWRKSMIYVYAKEDDTRIC